MSRKVSALVRRYVADRGWHILSVSQPSYLFPDDGRRLKRCCVPSDPWQATIGDRESYFFARDVRHGQGATADDAVLAAIPSDLLSALRRCEEAVDSLRDCLQK